MKSRLLNGAGLVAGALALWSATAIAADVNIKVATTVSTKHSWIKVLDVLQKETDKRLPGKVHYQIFLGGQLGKDPVVLAGLQTGTHMMSLQGSSPASILPEYTLFDAPFMFSGRDQVKRVIQAVAGDIKKAGLKKGIVITGIGELGFRQISNNVRPIVKPADLNGVKLRTPDNPFRITIFKHFGANPTPMAFPEVYVALRQGVIDGQENPLSSINSAKFYEVQKAHLHDLPRVHPDRDHDQQDALGQMAGRRAKGDHGGERGGHGVLAPVERRERLEAAGGDGEALEVQRDRTRTRSGRRRSRSIRRSRRRSARSFGPRSWRWRNRAASGKAVPPRRARRRGHRASPERLTASP